MADDVSEHSFTATGPVGPDVKVHGAGFATFSDEIDNGVNVQGNSVGLYAESVNAASNRKPPFQPGAAGGIGACGVSDGFGVVGAIRPSPGRRGLAGVVGQHRGGGVGMVGVSMDTAAGRSGIGVAGISHISSNPGELATPPDPAGGRGTGVLGSSGHGTGVRGTSAQGVGVVGVSRAAAGVRATGRVGVQGEGSGGPGGEFKSHETHAQLRLVPHGVGGTPTNRQVPAQDHRISPTELPKDGKLGELLVTSHDASIQCLLWLCVDASAGKARWAQVLLGLPMQGTQPVTEGGGG
jgi:hypothetical protein